MSKNLYSTRFDIINDGDACVIDNNGRAEEIIEEAIEEAERRRMEEAEADASSSGFTDGLDAENIDGQTDADDSGNVIRAEKMPDIEKVKAEADQILADARVQADDILTQARQDAEAARQSVYKEAQQQGYDHGKQDAESEAEQMKERLNQQQKDLEDRYQGMIDAIEPQLVDTISAVYEHIFHVDVSGYHEIVLQLVTSAIRNSKNSRKYFVHVSGEDYPALSMEKKKLQEAAGSSECSVDIIEDVSMGKGQCLIENENGILDCGIDTELTELHKKLKLLSFRKD